MTDTDVTEVSRKAQLLESEVTFLKLHMGDIAKARNDRTRSAANYSWAAKNSKARIGFLKNDLG